jgi:hypothetical protein
MFTDGRAFMKAQKLQKCLTWCQCSFPSHHTVKKREAFVNVDVSHGAVAAANEVRRS